MSTIETTVQRTAPPWRRERRSPKGIRRYMDCLRHLVEWDGGRDVREITKADLSCLEAWWWDDFEARNGREPAEATVAAMQVAAIQYFGYLEQEELIEPGPCPPHQEDQADAAANDWLRSDEDAQCWPLRRTCGAVRVLAPPHRYADHRGGVGHQRRRRHARLDDHSPQVQDRRRCANDPRAPGAPARARGVATVPAHPRAARAAHPGAGDRTGRPMDKWQVLCVVKRVAVRADLRVYPVPMGAAMARRRHIPVDTSKVSAHTLRRTFGSDLSTVVQGLRWSPSCSAMPTRR